MDRDKFKVRVNQRGEIWKWEEGKELEGIYRGQIDGKFGKLGQMDTIVGEQVTFPVPTVLARHLRRVRVGAECCIVFLGLVTSQKGGREYQDFDVYLSREEDRVPVEPGETDDVVPF
jgi:hypothetical protein